MVTWWASHNWEVIGNFCSNFSCDWPGDVTRPGTKSHYIRTASVHCSQCRPARGRPEDGLEVRVETSQSVSSVQEDCLETMRVLPSQVVREASVRDWSQEDQPDWLKLLILQLKTSLLVTSFVKDEMFIFNSADSDLTTAMLSAVCSHTSEKLIFVWSWSFC